MFFDPMYFLFLAPAMLLGAYAQWRVKTAYHHGRTIRASSGVTGAETAAIILKDSNVHHVRIADVPGQLTDHYSPKEKVLRLSPEVYEGNSIASLGIAAHEVGHALQDANRYPLLVVRNAIVPLANFGSSAGVMLLMGGLMLAFRGLIWLGIAVFSLTVLFQLVNLPVEFDASRRAKKHLLSTGLIAPEEEKEVSRVLNAAALTYVAATLTGVMTILFYIIRFRGAGRSRG